MLGKIRRKEREKCQFVTIGTSSNWRLSSYSTVRDPMIDIGNLFQVEGGDGVRRRDQEFVASIGAECSDDGEVEEVTFLVYICAVFDGRGEALVSKVSPVGEAD